MLCSECNLSSGCYCHVTKSKRYQPRDHKKERSKWEAWLLEDDNIN